MRKFIRSLLYFLFRTLARLEVYGIENIPLTGGCILAGNHLGTFDGPLIYSLIPRQDATALVAHTHQRNPFYRWIVDQVGGIWIDRSIADFHALKLARQYLQNGGLLGISPEGTRSKSGEIQQPKPGAAFLASMVADIPIIPAAITGTENAAYHLWRLQRPRLRVQFGEPFTLLPLDRKDKDASLTRNTDEIMCRIAAMLPPEYRGVYADHPRLLALTSSQA